MHQNDGILRSLTARAVIEAIMERQNDMAHRKGFWDEDHGHHTNGSKLNLIHAEVSEVTEACRHVDDPSDLGSTVVNFDPSEKIPDFTHTEEELADIILRTMCLAHERRCRLWEAIVAKLNYNETREYMHGKKIG